jgi:predicted dehydrogenase/sugar phosphate isomerase/epimerase
MTNPNAVAVPSPPRASLADAWSRVGCSLLTFRKLELWSAVEQVRALGFTALDVAAVPGFCDQVDVLAGAAPFEELAWRLADAGLRVSSVNAHPGDVAGPDHLGVTRSVRASLAAARALGAKVLTIPPGPDVPPEAWEATAARVAGRVRGWLDLADAEGVRLSLEAPHVYTLADDLQKARRLFDLVGDPRIGCTFDTSHAQRGHHRPLVECLSAVGAEVVHVHLRDSALGRITVTPGKGDCDYQPMLRALVAGGYRGDFNFELEGEGIEGEAIVVEAVFARQHLRHLLHDEPLPFSHRRYHTGWYRAWAAAREVVLHPRKFVVERPRLKALLRPPVLLLRTARREWVPYRQIAYQAGWRTEWRVGRSPRAISPGPRRAPGASPARRVAILGCGYTGGSMHGPGFARLPGVEVVGVCDPVAERVQASARQLGCRAFADGAEMIAQVKPDLVVNCTREWLHHPTTLLALRSGADVFCEKILAEDLAKGEELVREARARGRVLGVNFNWRFLPGIQRLRELVEQRPLGRLRMLRFLAHGATHHHALDLARFLGGPIRRLSASIQEEPESRGFKPWNDYVGELLYMPSVYCLANLETEQGVGVSLASSFLLDYGGVLLSVDAVFQEGTVTLSGIRDGDAYGTLTACARKPVDLRMGSERPGEFALSFQRSIEAFGRAWLEGQPPPISGEDALQVMRLEHALVESARRGAAVTL